MKDKAYIRGLLEYNAWANHDLFDKVYQIPPEEVIKPREANLESISDNLHHLLVIDRIWLAHMEKRDHGYSDRRGDAYDTLDELWDERQKIDARLITYLEELAPEELEESIDYQLIGSTNGALSRSMCFTHIVIHGSYHRGWITDMFAQAKEKTPIADLPVYERVIREQKLTPLP